MMTKGGKEEEKIIGPLFPRLHVNDTSSKGGPRAPPRNKMALYEQFSVPSQRFKPASTVARLPSCSSACNLAPSASSSQDYTGNRNLFPSFLPHSREDVCFADKQDMRSADKLDVRSDCRQSAKSARTELERRPVIQLKSRLDFSFAQMEFEERSSGHALKQAHVAGAAEECSSRGAEDMRLKNSNRKKPTTEDDGMVPSVLCSGIQLRAPAAEKDEVPAPLKLMDKRVIPDGKQNKTMVDPDLRSIDSHGTSRGPSEAFVRPTTRDKCSVPISDSKSRKLMKIAENSFSNDCRSNAGASKETHGASKRLCVESLTRAAIPRDARLLSDENGSMKQTATDIIANRMLLSERISRGSDAKENKLPNDMVGERKDGLSNSSAKPKLGAEITADDVVGAIGPKHFWKVRRAIVNQQRVFAVQVFELHRLIKVQKLFASSPDLLLEADPTLGKSLAAASKKPPVESALISQSLSGKNINQDEMPRLKQPTDLSKENTEGNLPRVSCEDILEGDRHEQPAASVPACSVAAAAGNCPPPPAPAVPENNKSSGWWLPQPPPNQWLVPVMSPSEGLIYKPYTGPCPPAGSFMPPFFPPISMASATPREFPSSGYGVPMPHQPPPQQDMGLQCAPPMAPTYFPPFSLPTMNNPVVSVSAVEQVSNVVAASQPNTYTEQHSGSSCNMLHRKSGAAVVSGDRGVWRFHVSRDSELQGSTASSPFHRADAEGREVPPPPLPLNGSKEQQRASVIRVVPHNAESASESAARIFRSIQKERQQ